FPYLSDPRPSFPFLLASAHPHVFGLHPFPFSPAAPLRGRTGFADTALCRSELSATFTVVTASSASFAVVTEPSAIFTVVIASSATVGLGYVLVTPQPAA